MRTIRYSVAMSLDGFIAGPNEEIDWILMDPDIDFGAFMGRFDAVVMGRHAYRFVLSMGAAAMPKMPVFVASRTLPPDAHPGVTVLGENLFDELRRLRAEPGKDIWIFGGGVLFASLLGAGLVDEVEVAVIPVVLGAGRSLSAPMHGPASLRLVESKVLPKTGTVMLTYAVDAPGTKMLEPRFQFYEIVRVRRGNPALAAVHGAVGAILGRSDPAPSCGCSYAVYFGAEEGCWSIDEADLAPTGRQASRSDFYDDAARIRVRVDEQGWGWLADEAT